MILVHGTTEKGLKAIINRDGKDGLAAPWDVSDNDRMSYFYDAAKVDWTEDLEDAKRECIGHALEQAQLQKALEAEGGKIYALVVDVPEEFVDIVEDDYSCPNMESVASCMPEEQFDPDWIVEVYEANVNVWSIPFVLACVIGNPMFQSYKLPKELVDIAQQLALSEICYDITDLEWNKVSLNILSNIKDKKEE
ncbi:hypothetical protein [Pseudomonas phage pPA-3099-2aT.2]|uniref:Uncharacterized protein n=1 Tax=Pseudomonas phage pPA-3099-2aT.2 TaxID=3003808 RepID=A0AAE9W7R2_9CAUD|nr:hypothetical protein QE325_gp126 [Pseudomonas phage pPA-3099-2aT.2]WBQ35255.1 hypothetical protein [Pseudomonas phage pPA-3099-2aT.2]